ncbi:MAG TPA: phytochelatin synthase family protein, partial [Anaeromyxobacter sp.]
LLKHGLDSQIRVVGEGAEEKKLEAEIVANLATANDYVLVNYQRDALGQKGRGHISPVGAYDEPSDSFLILDVNPNHGNTWVWVPAHALFSAMRTKDTVENRGFLLVREGRPH